MELSSMEKFAARSKNFFKLERKENFFKRDVQENHVNFKLKFHKI